MFRIERERIERVARMYAELFSGLHTDPARHLQKFFLEDYDEWMSLDMPDSS